MADIPAISVLFLCTRNAARSQMAEAFLRRHGGDRYDVHSAGIEPTPIDPLATSAMEELGYDMAGQRSKSASEYLGKKSFAYTITVCQHAEQQCPRLFMGSIQHLYWPFDDPGVARGSADERMAVYRRVRDGIQSRVLAWLAANAASR